MADDIETAATPAPVDQTPAPKASKWKWIASTVVLLLAMAGAAVLATKPWASNTAATTAWSPPATAVATPATPTAWTSTWGMTPTAPTRAPTTQPPLRDGPIGSVDATGRTSKYEWPGTVYKPTAQELNSSLSYTVDFIPKPSEKTGRWEYGYELWAGRWTGGEYVFEFDRETAERGARGDPVYSMTLDFFVNHSNKTIWYTPIRGIKGAVGHYHILDRSIEDTGSYQVLETGRVIEAGKYYYYRFDTPTPTLKVFTYLYVPEEPVAASTAAPSSGR